MSFSGKNEGKLSTIYRMNIRNESNPHSQFFVTILYYPNEIENVLIIPLKENRRLKMV
jgi:hypothetical protein